MKRSENKWIGGVLGGISKYYNLDTTTLRLVFLVAFVLSSGTFFATLATVYFSLWFIVPDEE